MKFDILNIFTGAVQFTAEIDCNKDESISIKIGLAVKWAVKNKADLSSANLRFADLRSADLRSANLRFANLRFADLRSANLSSANLRSANLSSADLRFLQSANGKELACMNAGKYQVVLSKERIAIGCKLFTVGEWKEFNDATISMMDDGALEWWRKWKDLVFMFHKNIFG